MDVFYSPISTIEDDKSQGHHIAVTAQLRSHLNVRK